MAPERASTSTRCRISVPAVTSIRQTGARSLPALAAGATSAGSNAHNSARPARRVGAATWCVRATRATAVRVAAAAETVRAAEDKDNGVVSPLTDRRLPSPSTATANSPPMTGRPPTSCWKRTTSRCGPGRVRVARTSACGLSNANRSACRLRCASAWLCGEAVAATPAGRRTALPGSAPRKCATPRESRRTVIPSSTLTGRSGALAR